MSENPNDWGIGTRLTRGGLARSANMEMAEALYLTQGYVYDSAESADARFSGEEPGFVYTRYGNPTVKMFEDRLALLDGAEACKATATGMAAMHLAFMGLVKAGDHVVAGRALFGSCRWILHNWAPRFGVESTLVDGPDLAAWRAAVRPNTKVFLIESPANPLLEMCDIAGVVRHRPRDRRQGGRRQRLRHPDLPVAAEARRRRRVLFGDQAHRRPAAGCMGGAVLGGHGPDGGGLQATSRDTSARRCRRSTPGCCSRDSRRWICGCARKLGPPPRLPMSSLPTRSRPDAAIPHGRITPSTRSPCAR